MWRLLSFWSEVFHSSPHIFLLFRKYPCPNHVPLWSAHVPTLCPGLSLVPQSPKGRRGYSRQRELRDECRAGRLLQLWRWKYLFLCPSTNPNSFVQPTLISKIQILETRSKIFRWESLHDFDTVWGYLVELNIWLGKRFLSALEQVDRFGFCGKGHEAVVHIEVPVHKVWSVSSILLFTSLCS